MSIHELQAALRALDRAKERDDFGPLVDVFGPYRSLVAAARRVAEGAGEPVAWRCRYMQANGIWSAWWDQVDAETMNVEAQEWRYCGRQVETQTLYTTPPSADALVEALEKLSAEWRTNRKARDSYQDGVNQGRDYCADAIDALIAKHKENTDGR